MAAAPAARLMALPMNVDVCAPGGQWLMNAARPTTAETAIPPPIPLPTVIRSGTTPQCSAAHARPVRPNPHWISSKISTVPWRSQSSRRPARKPAGGTTTPPLPWTGSTTIAATGPTPDAGSSRACRARASAPSPADVAVTEWPAVGVRVGQEVGVRVATDLRPDRGLAVEPDHAAAATEVATREGDDLTAARSRPRQLERCVVRVRSRHAEQDAVEPRRRDADECLLEGDPLLADRRRGDVAGSPACPGWRRRPWDGCGRRSPRRSSPPGRRTGCRRDRRWSSREASSTTRGASGPPVRGPAPSTARIRSMTRRARGPG